ncbi:NAAT family transporter [Candidatus Woesearchaeota archaeon]|nr:NAAT family transporter [Candidatus Woesearchaeota archaeon]
MDIYPLLTHFGLAFSAIFTIVNPFSSASFFLTITEGESKVNRKYMSKKAALCAFFVLLVFAVLGNYILRFFGITINAFMIAGGIIISGIGYSMINTRREKLHTDEEKQEAIDKEDVSIIPMAIPMLSGPGAITTSIVLMGNSLAIIDKVIVILAIAAVCFVSYVVLSRADILDERMGSIGRRIVGRIMGLIVLVIGVQFVIDGVVPIIKLILAA